MLLFVMLAQMSGLQDQKLQQ